MPTWRERAGIGVVPRTDTVPEAETPSAETLIVVNPTQRLDDAAFVDSRQGRVRAFPDQGGGGTAAPAAFVARTAIGVSEPRP
jgi:hypothetical protein